MHPIDEIAAVIRQHPNSVDTDVLAAALAEHLRCNTEPVGDFLCRTNPDRTMGAGALAEAIWNSELFREPCAACNGTGETSEGWECSSCGGSSDASPADCVDGYPEHNKEITYGGSDGVGWRCRRCDAEGWDPAEGK